MWINSKSRSGLCSAAAVVTEPRQVAATIAAFTRTRRRRARGEPIPSILRPSSKPCGGTLAPETGPKTRPHLSQAAVGGGRASGQEQATGTGTGTALAPLSSSLFHGDAANAGVAEGIR